MRLSGRHLVHQVGRIDRLVLRLSGGEQLRIEGVIEEEGIDCFLVGVGGREIVAEAPVVVDIKLVGGEVVALWAEVWAVGL